MQLLRLCIRDQLENLILHKYDEFLILSKYYLPFVD